MYMYIFLLALYKNIFENRVFKFFIYAGPPRLIYSISSSLMGRLWYLGGNSCKTTFAWPCPLTYSNHKKMNNS